VERRKRKRQRKRKMACLLSFSTILPPVSRTTTGCILAIASLKVGAKNHPLCQTDSKQFQADPAICSRPILS
jgi:hypothetical protein